MSTRKKRAGGRPQPRRMTPDERLHAEMRRADAEAAPWGPIACPECSLGSFIGPPALVHALVESEGLVADRGLVDDLERLFVEQDGDVDRVLLLCLLGCGYLGFIPVAELVLAPVPVA